MRREKALAQEQMQHDSLVSVALLATVVTASTAPGCLFDSLILLPTASFLFRFSARLFFSPYNLLPHPNSL